MDVRCPILEHITTDVYLCYHRNDCVTHNNDCVTHRNDYLLRQQFADCRVHQGNSNRTALCKQS